MNICDRCKEEKVALTLKFKTKKFEICEKCAKKIVEWLEKKPLRGQLNDLWDNTNKKYNLNTLGGNY